MSISSSDFVFDVKGDSASEANLSKLVGVLKNAGFETQARPGTGLSTLLFARLANKKYDELLRQDLTRCFQFGVTADDDLPADRPRTVYSYLTSPSKAAGVAITPGKGEWKFIDAVVPISAFLADENVTTLARKAAASASLDTSSNLKLYGSEVALYFEFLKFYIGALSILAIFGAMAHIKSKNYSMTFTFVNLTWTVVFLIFWKRRERYLTNSWGLQNSHLVEEYDADLADIENKPSSYVGRDKSDGFRFAKELAFLPVALVFVAVLVSYQLGCFVLEIFLSEIYNGPGKMFLTLTPTVLISVFVPILTMVYNIVANKFLTWENHDNNYQREDSFIVKTFTLNFLTGYVPLLITSFIYLPFAHLIQPYLPIIQFSIASSVRSDRYMYKYLTKVKSQKEFTINQGRLNAQFFYFIVTNQVIQLIMKYALPLIISSVMDLVNSKVLGKKELSVTEDSPEEKEWLDKVRKVVKLPAHNANDDFRGLALQFGYLSLFGPVWTLAPLLSVVFNVLTFKLDQLKLANGKYFRPPVPKRVDSIHPWDLAFLALAWIGSIVSPLVTAFYRHGTKPPKTLGQFALSKASINVSSTTTLIFVLFISEHLFFALYFLGSKISSYLKSDPEIKNSFVDNDIKLRKQYYGEKVQAKEIRSTSSDWKSLPVEQVVKQAHLSEREAAKEREEKEKQSKSKSTGSSNTGAKSSPRSAADAGAAGVATGASTGVAAADKSTLSNRTEKIDSDRLTELEEKKRQLEEKKQELARKQTLESQMDAGDQVINVPSDSGASQKAIIDGDNHISTEDVKDIERKLSVNTQTTPKSRVPTEKDREIGITEPDLSDSTPSKENKPSKKASLKKIFKGK